MIVEINEQELNVVLNALDSLKEMKLLARKPMEIFEIDGLKLSIKKQQSLPQMGSETLEELNRRAGVL